MFEHQWEWDAKPGIQEDAICSILDQKHQDVPPTTTNPPVPTATANMTARLKVTPHRARRWSQNLTKDAPSPPSGDNVDKVEPFSKYSDTSPGKRLLEQPLCQIATYAVVLPGIRLTLGAFALSLSYFTLYGVIVRKYPISKVLIASKRDFCQTTWAPMGNAAAKNAENAVVAADDLINIDPRLWDQDTAWTPCK